MTRCSGMRNLGFVFLESVAAALLACCSLKNAACGAWDADGSSSHVQKLRRVESGKCHLRQTRGSVLGGAVIVGQFECHSRSV